MEPIYIILIVIGAIIFLTISFLIKEFNGLTKLRNRVEDQWAQIDVQLKKRFDLIPNLVETVKGYAKHETETFENVIKARNSFTAAGTAEGEIKASGELTQALGKLFALAEAYPELKANENFKQMQIDLKDIEEKIAYARQFYNDAVLTYKNKREMFPSNIVAGMFNFVPKPFFEASDSEREVQKVSFQ